MANPSSSNSPDGTLICKGLLGFPLGKMITVEGIVIDGCQTRSKADMGKLLLKVEKVNNKKSAKEIILTLNFFPWAGVKMPQPGARYKYIGYESGSFEGIPEQAFAYLPRVATESFHFARFFQVCHEESPGKP